MKFDIRYFEFLLFQIHYAAAHQQRADMFYSVVWHLGCMVQ